MDLIRLLVLIQHLCLSGGWLLGVDLKDLHNKHVHKDKLCQKGNFFRIPFS